MSIKLVDPFVMYILVCVNIFANYPFHNSRLPHKISLATVRQLTYSIFYSRYAVHFLKAAGNVLHGDSPGAIFRRRVSPRRTRDFFHSRIRARRADSLRDSSNFVGACGTTRRRPRTLSKWHSLTDCPPEVRRIAPCSRTFTIINWK